MPKAPKKQSKRPRKIARRPLTPFNERIIAARQYSGLTQAQLAAACSCEQTAIEKLENRGANGSTLTVQIAKACNVSPYWLAADEGEMLSAKDVSADAVAFGVAWAHLRGAVKDRFAKELLELALNFLPPNNPYYRHAQTLFRDALKKRGISEQLQGATKPAHNR